MFVITMNDVQKKELEVLKEFIRVCEKHNLTYFLIGGSALGAIRHKGFIPWDDDIDVGMPREDYDKYLELQHEYDGTPYFIQTFKTDPCYVYNFAKLRDSSTTYIEYIYKNFRINHGVWIDIFPIDGISKKMVEPKKLAKKIRHLWVQVWLAFLPALRRKVRKETWFKDILLNIVAGLFYIFDIAHYRNKKIERIVHKIPFAESVMAGNCFGFNMKKEAMDSNIFRSVIKVPFEDIEVNIMKDYDTYLHNIYGDYMTPPPPDKQVGHHYNRGLDLNMGYDEYMRKHKI